MTSSIAKDTPMSMISNKMDRIMSGSVEWRPGCKGSQDIIDYILYNNLYTNYGTGAKSATGLIF